jgi:hypothetical protein
VVAAPAREQLGVGSRRLKRGRTRPGLGCLHGVLFTAATGDSGAPNVVRAAS